MGAAYLWCSTVITTAMRLTPVRTGWLRRSRFVEHPSESGFAFTLRMGFSATYAAAVHDRNARHPTGEWKFLSTAVSMHAPSMSRVLAAHTFTMLRSGVGFQSIPPVHPTSAVHGPPPPVRRLTVRQRRLRAARAELNAAKVKQFGPGGTLRRLVKPT
jgi:hypothetical protein